VNEKFAKQVFTAAKRVSKKRPSTAESSEPSVKRGKLDTSDVSSQIDNEKSLKLPTPILDEEEIAATVLLTNRAPIVLAFAVQLLLHTRPEQPVSSRLSLAQAVVSMNSKSKAVNLGIEKGKTAEEEGWGIGQPSIKIMGRDVYVLRRYDVPTENDAGIDTAAQEAVETIEENAVGHHDKDETIDETSQPLRTVGSEPALWGLDLEAFKSLNRSKAVSSSGRGPTNTLPTHSSKSAKAYLLKSFPTAPQIDAEEPASRARSSTKRKSATSIVQEKEHNLALLLGSLDLLFKSWAPFISNDELDRRAWSWYVNVRPDVQTGTAGWGGKGEVRLASLLNLRRKG
jgi:hypothetical protein